MRNFEFLQQILRRDHGYFPRSSAARRPFRGLFLLVLLGFLFVPCTSRGFARESDPEEFFGPVDSVFEESYQQDPPDVSGEFSDSSQIAGQSQQAPPQARWSIPRPHLPNMQSVYNLLPQREPENAVQPTRIDLPGFQGRFISPDNRPQGAVPFPRYGEEFQENSGSQQMLRAPSPLLGGASLDDLFTPDNEYSPIFGTGPFLAPNPLDNGSQNAPIPSSRQNSTFLPFGPTSDPDINSMMSDFSGNSSMYYPTRDPAEPITITAKSAWSKTLENGSVVYFLEGGCAVQQGPDLVRGPKAVIWIDAQNLPKTAYVYLESEDSTRPLSIELAQGKADARIQDQKWFGSFQTTSQIDVLPEKRAFPQKEFPPIYSRAEEMRFPGARKFETRQLSQSFNLGGKTANFRSIQYYPRSDSETEISWTNDAQTNRSTALITNGFTIVIDGISVDGAGSSLLTGDTIDISADRAVIWTEHLDNLTIPGEKRQRSDYDLEIYLEGNIIFREGSRTIYAKKMYYDVKNRIGYLLDAEFLAPATGFEGLVRMRAEVLQQLGANHFLATNSYLTTSRLGEPAYRVQSNRMTFDEIVQPLYDTMSGTPLRDPSTGRQLEKKRQLLVAENNVVCLGHVPVLYWPWMAADLQYKDPFMYIRSVSFAHDGRFGTQVRTTWNPYQIFNIKNRPEGTDWDLSLDYLSKRGLGHGTNFTYARGNFFGIQGPTAGLFDFWGIKDGGEDNLGKDRRDIDPEASYRYRAIWKHRQDLSEHWRITAEFGKVSDRTFMEEYFESEWDTMKNQSTGLELKKTDNNRSFSVYLGGRMDDFVTDTNWLPKLEHSWMGQSLLQDRLTWYEHTKIGYAQFKASDAPESANNFAREHKENYYMYLPWEIRPGSSNDPDDPALSVLEAKSEFFSTKHELDLPFNAGPFKVVPYVLGEFAHWGDDMNQDSVQRFYYQGGIRMNLPMWKLMPRFQSRTLYANGLAHKIDFNAEFSYARADTDWDSLVQYEALDDYSVQDFRRRYSYMTYGGAIPVQFDERYYAIRSGIASHVSSPATALADDLTLVRLGMKNRWQTKRGPTGNQRIIDWIVLDTNLNLYPEKEQNFGETIGLIDYDFRWHVGDRFALLSSGIYDLFHDGQQITRFGAMSERPERGRVYLGVDRLDGPFTATYLNLNLAYQMNEKYSMEFGSSYDLSDGKSQGHNLIITRTGESFAFSLATSMNPSRDVWGVSLNVRPVFLTNYKNRIR